MKVHTYPELPLSCQKLWYYLNDNGLQYSIQPEGCQIGIHIDLNELCKYTQKVWPFPVINGELTDCSKTEIERLHKKIFGYGSWIEGKCNGWHVIKEDKQCSKSAYLYFFTGSNMPELKPGQFIQKFFGLGLVCEYRAIIMGDIVAWIVKEKQVTSDNLNGKLQSATWTNDKEKYLTIKQRAKILQFCQEMNLEFGEIDILISDDKIYIIDVNNQPGDNAFHLSHIGFDSEDFRKYLCGKFMDYLTSKLW